MKIKHILVNWALEDEELLEPYEWEDEDDLEVIDEAKLLHVSSEVMPDLLEGILKIENIEEGTYLCSDTHMCLAIRIDENHRLVCRSVLPFEYRSAMNDVARCLNQTELHYEIYACAQNKEYGLTREEREKKQWLMEHIEMMSIQELESVYPIVFPLEKNCSRTLLLNRLEVGFDALHEYLYECFVTQKRLS